MKWPTSSVIANLISTSSIENKTNPLCNISSDYGSDRSLDGVRCSDMVSNVVQKSLYVDDCLPSARNEQESRVIMHDA